MMVLSVLLSVYGGVLGGRGSQRMIDSTGLSLPGILCGHGSQRMIDSITLSPPGILCGRGSQRMNDSIVLFLLGIMCGRGTRGRLSLLAYPYQEYCVGVAVKQTD